MRNKLKAREKGTNEAAAQNHGIQKPYGISYEENLLKQ